jgi:predicted phosphodiesterase
MRIAVIGDIHANAGALTSALAAADSGGYDRLVFIGDLLTYGADVIETLDLVGERLVDHRTVLIRGNHDALYSNLVQGESTYVDQLQDWIRESVTWTLDRLPIDRWSELPFQDEYELEGVLFSHANPFGSGRWEYLGTPASLRQAAEALRDRGFRIGVFGHTHRVKWYRHVPAGGESEMPFTRGDLDGDAVHVLNPGSIGQPRDASSPVPHVLWMSVGETSVAGVLASFTLQRVHYDVVAHLSRLATSGLSVESLSRITAYFDSPASPGSA